MFNVLPDNFKKIIKGDYRLHKWVVILFVIFFIQVSCLIFFMPSWVSTFYKEKELISQLNNVNGVSSPKDVQNKAYVIKQTNAKLKIMDSNMSYPKTIPLIKSILSNKISGISISELSYSSSNATTAIVSFNGVSDTRDSLILYVSTLEQTKLFKKVDLPISNLAKSKNIEFSMNLTVSQ